MHKTSREVKPFPVPRSLFPIPGAQTFHGLRLRRNKKRGRAHQKSLPAIRRRTGNEDVAPPWFARAARQRPFLKVR